MILSIHLHIYIFIPEHHNDKKHGNFIHTKQSEIYLVILSSTWLFFLTCWQMIHWDEKSHFIVQT